MPAPTLPTVPIQRTAVVVAHDRIARDTVRLRLDVPEVAAAIRPGQFVMVRLKGFTDPLIGRPLAVWETHPDGAGRPRLLDVVYLVKGKFTTRMATMPNGTEVELWGPLGNGFPPSATDELVLVAGGIGQTPFLAVARDHLGQKIYGRRDDAGGGRPRPAASRRATLLYGARSADRHAGVEEFRRAGVDVHLATDDGSAGFRGTVAELLDRALGDRHAAGANGRGGVAGTTVYICGPEPMMAAASAVAARHGAAAWVSLETPMACGIGICFTCVARIRDEAGGVDYRRTCVEGPVFPAGSVAWD